MSDLEGRVSWLEKVVNDDHNCGSKIEQKIAKLEERTKHQSKMIYFLIFAIIGGAIKLLSK